MSALDGLYNGSPATMTSDGIPVSGVTGDAVIDIFATVEITHTWVGDLTLKLVSPDGDTLTLMSRPGLAEVDESTGQCCGPGTDWLTGEVALFADYGTTDAELMGDGGAAISSTDYFPSPGITAYPTTSFADLFGGTMNGTWTLFVGDGAGGDPGMLDAWSLTIVTASPSFTLSKTVSQHDGAGDCTNDLIPTTNNIGVNVGDSVCYFYTATNTGDVDLDFLDFVDDILAPGGIPGLPFPLAVTDPPFTFLWSAVPTEITAEVTNIATVTYYDIETGLAAGPEVSEATVGIIPPNDECANAIPLTCGVPTSGTTYFSTETGNPTGCALFANDLGVWYSFVGDGGVAQITTCGAISETDGVQPWLAIFEGPCGAEVCVASGSTADATCGTANGWTVEAQTVAGTTYYVYVTSITGNPIVLDFDITLNCLPPANDLCVDAIPLVCDDVVTGNTDTATDTDASACDADGLGVWFTFTGDGSTAILDLSNSDYDTYLGVTETCGGVCLESDDDGGVGTTSLISFVTTPGQDYFVQVSGFGANTGNYELSYTCYTPPPPPANDLCVDAIPVVCGETVSGYTESGTADAAVGFCGTTLTTAPGVWYSFVGTGEDVTATTCNLPGTNFDTKLGVFSGDCNTLVCVDGNDDHVGTNPDCIVPEVSATFNRASTVEFFGVAGTTYYIYVTGFSSAVGEFDLTVSCVCTADAGTTTADASPVCMSGGSATISATHDGNSVVPTGYIQLAVLADAASGILLNADPVSSFAVTAAGDYIITTAVYDPLQFDPGTLPPGTTLADINALLIQGGGTMCGGLDMTGATITVNEEPTATMSGGGVSCDGAPVDVEIAFTGTGPWSVDYTDPVGVLSLTGVTDNPLVISTTSVGGYSINSMSDANCPGTVSGSAAVTSGNMPVAGFTSAQVASTLDVDFTDASTGVPTDWLWDFGDGNTSTDQNPTHTYAAAGSYAVCLTVTNECGSDSACDATVDVLPVAPANDLCVNAETIVCGQTLAASTLTATDADNQSCGAITSAGVWYTFEGTDEDWVITTCNPGTDYDTEIEVFDGVCGSLNCIDSNDDQLGDFDPACDALANGFNRASTLTVTTSVGTTYYLYVGGFSSEIGNFELSVTCVPSPTPPVNDAVCSALPLSYGPNGPYSNVLATVGPGETVLPDDPTCNAQTGWCFDQDVENSVWFTFVAPASGNVTVSTDGGDYDSQLAAYDAASCQDIESGTATLLAANDDDPDASGSGGTTLTSRLILCDLTPGTTYYVLLDGWGGAEGETPIELTETTIDAGFTYAATGLSVDFTDASSTSSTIASYMWDFGDGNTSTDMNPTHVYALDGPYTVCLTVTDENGCTSVYCEAIQVTDPVTSIAEAVENGMEVYPNPSNGQFVVTVRGVEADVQIVVMDVAGRQVYNEGATLNNDFRKELKLDVAKGTYLLQIATVEGLVTRKIQVH